MKNTSAFNKLTHEDSKNKAPGERSSPLLNSMRIIHLCVENKDVRGAITNAVKSMNSMQAPVAVLFAGETLF